MHKSPQSESVSSQFLRWQVWSEVKGKWHFFLAMFSGKMNVYLSTVFVWVTDDLAWGKMLNKKICHLENKERKKKGAVKFSYCNAKELQLGDISPSKVSLFLSPNETQGSRKRINKKQVKEVGCMGIHWFQQALCGTMLTICDSSTELICAGDKLCFPS